MLILFILVFSKALLTSFTHDEAATFLNYVAFSFEDIINYEYVTANNHLLNSLLTKVSYHLIGQSEIGLRLPNVLGFLIFLIVFYKWILTQTNKYSIILLSVALMFLNPHEFEFFSLSRGYGLSYLFLFLSLKHLFSSHKPEQLHNTYFFFLWLILMVLSNFATLIVYLPIIFIFNLLNLKSEKQHFFYGLSLSIISAAILAAIITAPILKLIEKKQLYFGGHSNFYSDTIISLYNGFKHPFEFPSFVPVIFIILIGLASVFSVYLFVKSEYKFQSTNSFKVLIIISLTILTSISQHYILGSLYLIDRTALFLYILLAFFFISLFIDLSKRYDLNKVFDASILTLAGLFIFHFFTSFNFNSYKDWKHDSDTKELAFGLNELGRQNNQIITIAASQHLSPVINYYYKSRNLVWLNHKVKKISNTESDVYYQIKSDQHLFPGEMTFIASYSEAETSIFLNSISKINGLNNNNSVPIKLQTPPWNF
jgi:hypothetical protein